MKNILFLLPAMAILFSSCGTDKGKSGSYTVIAEMDGISGSDVVMMIEDPTNPQGFRIDSLKASSDKIEFKGNIDTVRVAMLAVDDPRFVRGTKEEPVPAMPVQFFIEPGETIHLQGDVRKMHLSRLSGSTMNDQMDLLVQHVKDQQVLVDSLVDLMRNAQSAGLDTPELRERIREEYLRLVEIYADFVKKNNDLDISPFIIKMYIAQFYEMKDLKALYDVLSERVKATAFGKLVADDFYESPELIGGTMAPDFTLTDKDNKSIKLADYKGNYLVISFWGSWCKPCRISHPKFVETVNKYKSKGLQVLGIAADRDMQEWLNAISEDKLSWQHVNAFSEQPLDILALYTIKAFPTKVIIDPEGKYLGQFVGDDPEFYAFLEKLYK